MTETGALVLIVAVCCGVLTFAACSDGDHPLALPFFAALTLLFSTCAYQESGADALDKEAAERRAKAAAERREQTPHVVREADGCKVYAFKSEGRHHYFTRCPDSRTTTESSWEECRTSGKITHCETKTENIGEQP